MQEQDDPAAAQGRAEVRVVLQIVAAGCGFDACDWPDRDPAADLRSAPETVVGR